jgi:hypothetical protein
MDEVKKRPRIEADRPCLATFQGQHQARMGRRNCPELPRHARTSAFAPKRQQPRPRIRIFAVVQRGRVERMRGLGRPALPTNNNVFNGLADG